MALINNNNNKKKKKKKMMMMMMPLLLDSLCVARLVVKEAKAHPGL
jgi:hypothetical protein